jgi:hypothetical protein
MNIMMIRKNKPATFIDEVKPIDKPTVPNALDTS